MGACTGSVARRRGHERQCCQRRRTGGGERGAAYPGFGPRRSFAAMANERALFVRVFIASFTLQLLVLVTPLIISVITTRCLCVTGWAHWMRLFAARNAHGDAPGRLPAPRNTFEALAADGNARSQEGAGRCCSSGFVAFTRRAKIAMRKTAPCTCDWQMLGRDERALNR